MCSGGINIAAFLNGESWLYKCNGVLGIIMSNDKSFNENLGLKIFLAFLSCWQYISLFIVVFQEYFKKAFFGLQT